MAIITDSTASQFLNLGPHEPLEESCKALTNLSMERPAGDYEEEYEEEDGAEELYRPTAEEMERETVQAMFQCLPTDPVSISVHDVVIKGNSKTHDVLIEAEVLHFAGTENLVHTASLANAWLCQDHE